MGQRDSVFKYDVTSSSYDQLYRDEQFNKYYYVFFIKKLPVGKVVVDIGCGTGLLIEFLKIHGIDRFTKYFCIEPSMGMINVLLGKEVVDHRVIVINGYGEDLPLRDNSVDAVYVFTVWDNVVDKNRLLKEIDRVLIPSGYSVVTSIPKSSSTRPPDLDHRYRFIGQYTDYFYLYLKS